MAKRKAANGKAADADPTEAKAVGPKPAPVKPARKRKAASVSEAETPVQAPVLNGQPVTDEAIRMLAYQKWEAAGRPIGEDDRFWREAHEELKRAN